MQFYFCIVINKIALLISLLGNSILTYGSTFDFIMLSLYTANFAEQLYSFFSESLLSFILYCVSPVTIWFFSGVASFCFFLLPNCSGQDFCHFGDGKWWNCLSFSSFKSESQIFQFYPIHYWIMYCLANILCWWFFLVCLICSVF